MCIRDSPILQEPYELRDGALVIPERPGLGLEWDEAAVKANAWE